ncbi:Tensin-4 [Schistosoma japonicum]|nr:Tensin-4 [Schistosoma japonicum]
MNISGPSTMTKTGWLSETNLRNTSVCKQPPMYSTYSAHKENLRQMQEQRRTTEDWQASNRQLHDSRSVGSRAVLEEMETITLQPIGRGVHDLEPTSGSIARSVRATTPSAGRIDLGASGTKRSISKEYYSPFRMQRSTIDIPYSQTTNALISPPINRRLVGFANINPTTTRISSINRNILPTINHDTTMYDSSQLNSKWNIHSSNRSQGIINQSHFNRNSYARQTLTQNIQEMTQKQRIQSPNQLYYATPNHNELANRSYAPGWDQQDGFRTIATTNYHREMHTTSGPQSPYLGAIRQNSQYEATPLVANRSENQWKTVTPFSPTGSLSGTNIGTDVVDGDTAGMRQVLDTSKYWYLPGISRPDEAGSFVIRNSNTYADSFGLALKVPPNSPRVISNKEDAQSEWVRHFLIGTVPMHDGRGNGVHLRGFSSDPTFPSLAAFVHYHIHRQGALPCTLRLPVPTNQMLYNQQRTTVNDHTVYGLDTPLQTVLPTATTMYTDMLYLGSVEVDRLENMNAAIRGITQSYSDGLPKRCEVQIKVLPHEGITFTEKYKRGVWKKIIKPNNLLWCGMDPENREFNDIELRSKGVYGSKVFALVARKQRFWLHENVVYVFCEIDNNHPAINLVRFINSIFPGLRD